MGTSKEPGVLTPLYVISRHKSMPTVVYKYRFDRFLNPLSGISDLPFTIAIIHTACVGRYCNIVRRK